jgi:hypothetical protein
LEDENNICMICSEVEHCSFLCCIIY